MRPLIGGIFQRIWRNCLLLPLFLTPLSREDGHRLFINNILAYPSAASTGSVLGIWSWVAGLGSCRFNFDIGWDPHSIDQLDAYD